MIVGPAGLPNVPFAELLPAVSPFRPWLSGVGSRIEHMSERVLGVVEREALDRTRARLVALPGRALLTITMDLRWLQLATGYGVLGSEALVDPRTVRRWACDAEVVPVVLGSRSEPLDVGRLQRTVTDAIRRALNIRDGGCAFPGCDRPPRRCHAHHIRYWFHGGPTCLDNLVLLCRFHHQLIHAGHWVIEIHTRAPVVHLATLGRPRPATPPRRTTPCSPADRERPS